MATFNKHEQTQNEIHYQTMSEFLENTPPNKAAYISDLVVWENMGIYPGQQARPRKPNLNLHCSTDSCNRIMTSVPSSLNATKRF